VKTAKILKTARRCLTSKKSKVMLIHGAKDERAPIEQVKSLMKAMDEISKTYQYIEMDDEAHGYYDESNRLTIYQGVLDFLDKHIGR
jgi:dipeptidyl aminopeptidase/acylaminoacyl peptidase